MKLKILALAGIFLLHPAGPVSGQDSEPQSITIEEFRARMERAVPGEESAALMKMVFTSRRMDLFREWRPLMDLDAIMELTSQPSSPFKDDILLLLMEERWPTDGALDFSKPVILISFLSQEITKRMPEERLESDRRSISDTVKTGQLFCSRVARVALAARFRRMLERERGLEPGTLQPPPPDLTKEKLSPLDQEEWRVETGAAGNHPVVDSTAGSQTPAAAPVSRIPAAGPQSETGSINWLWMPAAAAGAGLLLWLIFRRWKSSHPS